MRTPGALAIAVLAIGGTLIGCAGGGGGGGGAPPKPACKPPATPAGSFSMTIQPIFNRSCALVSCHTGAVPAQGQDLTAGGACPPPGGRSPPGRARAQSGQARRPPRRVP